ncbi:MAG: hypothetical protein QOJ88_250 [Pyrinomonadaceae bacterium]|nr:hypothetical protein [Pyrinomonadaceae bacterium]
MRLRTAVFLCSLLLCFGCSQTAQPPANDSQSAAGSPASTTGAGSPSVPPGVATAAPDAGTAKPHLDACALLTSDEIQSVQGEAVKETKLTGQTTGGVNTSQCFYTLPTFTNSVSLVVAQKGVSAGATEPREFWRETFHKDKAEKRDRDRKRGEEEEEAGAPPQKIPGVGEEAYWTGSRVGGVLYALKGDAYVRVSIGGPGDQASKIKKSKTLAQKVLARL